MNMINENTDAIFDGQSWYYNIRPDSIQVDEVRGTVSFVITWRRRRGDTGSPRRVTLSLDCVKGTRERVTA